MCDTGHALRTSVRSHSLHPTGNLLSASPKKSEWIAQFRISCSKGARIDIVVFMSWTLSIPKAPSVRGWIAIVRYHRTKPKSWLLRDSLFELQRHVSQFKVTGIASVCFSAVPGNMPPAIQIGVRIDPHCAVGLASFKHRGPLRKTYATSGTLHRLKLNT